MNSEEKYKDEISFRNIHKNPLRLFGYSYFYVLIIILGIGAFYIKNLGSIERNSIQVIKDTLTYELDYKFTKGMSIEALDIKKISTPISEYLKKGKELYNSNCLSCHGETGNGNGIAGLQLTPRPRDFLSDNDWKNGRKISDIYKTLEDGIAQTGMASYNYLSPYDRFCLIHFVRSFMANPPIDQEKDLSTLNDIYKLNEPRIMNNQIPVSKAKEIILKEQRITDSNILFIIDRLKSDNNLVAALINANTYDVDLAVRFITANYKNGLSKEDILRKTLTSLNQNGFLMKSAKLSNSEWNLIMGYVIEKIN